MISTNYEHLLTPLRQIGATVEIAKPQETQVYYYTTNEQNIKSIVVDRVGENGKFFGFGISQKATITLLDKERTTNIEKDDSIDIYFDSNYTLPTFYVSSVTRDENTNELTIVAFDKIADAANHTAKELDLFTVMTLEEVAMACCSVLGIGLPDIPQTDAFLNVVYEGGGNISGSETIREVLDDIAEATQTIYFISSKNKLKFKSIDNSVPFDYVIDKPQYFTLDCKPPVMIDGIASVTELGDNLEYRVDGESGVVQYVRNNIFWTYAENPQQLLIDAVDNVCQEEIAPFNLKWRGNYFVEPVDKLEIETKDGDAIYTYLINDTITYNGGYSQVTKWEYVEQEQEHTNSATLGDILNDTFAKVDKVNREISLVANTVDTNSSEIAALHINTDSINQTVQAQQAQIDETTGNIETLTERVNLAITEEQLTIEVAAQIEDGVSKVRTGKNFTFDDNGLTIEDIKEDTNKVITTTVSNNGMVVKVDRNDVLTANDEGVTAVDLHAKTYLKIGDNSRFEDMGNRTACFWTGG